MTQPVPQDNFLSTLNHTPQVGAADVLAFWLGDGIAQGWPTQDLQKLWFGGGAVLDQEIKTKFGLLVVKAISGGLQAWEKDPLNRLALVILLDQLTRNVFRGDAQAFQGDILAQKLVVDSLATESDQQLPWVGRLFTYMPLMHAEDMALQQQCVAQITQLVADAPDFLKARLRGNLEFAQQHAEIIARFGRFPYRNVVLGRISTPEEEVFLVNGPRFGQ